MKLIKIILLLPVLILFNIGSMKALPTNKELIDSCVNKFSEDLVSSLKKTDSKLIILKFDESPEYLHNLIIDKLITNEIKVYSKFTEQNNTILSIKVIFNKLEFEYSEIDDELYLRNFNFTAKSFSEENNGEIKLFTEFNAKQQDKINKKDVLYLENELFSFTKGKKPIPKSSWYDEIIEPAIIISASIVTTILFFTVRSK